MNIQQSTGSLMHAVRVFDLIGIGVAIGVAIRTRLVRGLWRRYIKNVRDDALLTDDEWWDKG